MPSRPLGIAQLSFWFPHADDVCARAHETDGVRLVACWDSDAARGARKAQQFEVDFESDLERLLARPEVDAVSLCAEPFRHPDLVEMAAAHGKHLFIEKPMAADMDGATRILRAVRDSGVQAMPAYNLRHHPVTNLVKSLVEDGTLGRITRVRRLHGHYQEFEAGDFQARDVANEWHDPVRERRDSLFFAGSHAALWFEWMFGLPESVVCMQHTAVPGLPVEDNSSVLLRFPHGPTGVMENSETLIAQLPVAEIYGTEGVLVQLRGNQPSTRVLNPSHTPLWVFRREDESWEVPDLPPQFLRHEPAYSSPALFFSALLEDRPVPTSVESGLRSIAILAAAENSARERREVALSDVLGQA